MLAPLLPRRLNFSFDSFEVMSEDVADDACAARFARRAAAAAADAAVDGSREEEVEEVEEAGEGVAARATAALGEAAGTRAAEDGGRTELVALGLGTIFLTAAGAGGAAATMPGAMDRLAEGSGVVALGVGAIDGRFFNGVTALVAAVAAVALVGRVVGAASRVWLAAALAADVDVGARDFRAEEGVAAMPTFTGRLTFEAPLSITRGDASGVGCATSTVEPCSAAGGGVMVRVARGAVDAVAEAEEADTLAAVGATPTLFVCASSSSFASCVWFVLCLSSTSFVWSVSSLPSSRVSVEARRTIFARIFGAADVDGTMDGRRQVRPLA